MDKPPPPPLHSKKNELIDAPKAESDFPAAGSSEDQGMGSDSWRVAPSNAGSDAHKTASKFLATASAGHSRKHQIQKIKIARSSSRLCPTPSADILHSTW
jgi:hypothetical protein